VHPGGRHRWCGVLQPGEVDPIRRRDLLRQHRLKQAQCLPKLHRAALEITQNSEELLCCPLLKLLAHLVGRCTAQPFAQPEGRAPRKAKRQRGKLGTAAKCRARQRRTVACAGHVPLGAIGWLRRLVGHGPILSGLANCSRNRDERPSAAVG
jgi:hypothetical protein